MAWNTPGNKNDNRGQSTKQNGPPCLETFFKKLFGMHKQKISGNKKAFFFSLWLSMLIVLIWAVSGVYVLSVTEQAIIFKLGQYQSTETEGLHWYPRFIDRKYQFDIAATHTINVTEKLLTQDDAIVGIDLHVNYHLADIKDYLLNNQDSTVMIKQLVKSALMQAVASHTFAQIAMEPKLITQSIQTQLNDSFNNQHLGIVVSDITQGKLSLPESVKAAITKVADAKVTADKAADVAKNQAEKEITAARANSVKLLAEAKAYKQQAVIKAQSDVAGFNTLLPLYHKAPQLVTEQLYFDTMQDILSHHQLVVDSTAGGNVITLPSVANFANDTAASMTLISTPKVSDNTPKKTPAANSTINQQADYVRWESAQ